MMTLPDAARDGPAGKEVGPMTDVLPRLSASTTAVALQETLVELIDLSLQAKQAHWNVVGPNFRPLHEFLDELTDAYRGWYDDVAERLTAIGVSPDGRTVTVAARSTIPALPEGQLADGLLVGFVEDRVSTVARRIRGRMEAMDDDLVSQDLLIGIVHGLEKQGWMLRALRS
jgi:starvation-inducible DNA-binding protein